MDNNETRINQMEQMIILNSEQVNSLVVNNSSLVETNRRNNEILQLLYNHVKEVGNEFDNMKKENQSLKLDVEDLGNRLDKEKEIAINSLRKKAQLDEYCSQRDFGNNFRVKIGSKTVGKLFRVVGLAMKSRTNATIPYDNKCPRYARPSTFVDSYGRDTQYFKWNYCTCLKYMDEWFVEHELYEQFYSISKESEMEKYINNLHATFIG